MTVGDQFDTAEEFIVLNTVNHLFVQEVNETECFNGLDVPTRGSFSYVVETESPDQGLSRKRTRTFKAGEEQHFQLQAIDIYKNPKQQPGDNWSISLLSIPFTSNIGYSDSGIYEVVYSVNQSSSSVRNFGIATGAPEESILFSPYRFKVLPGDIEPLNTVFQNITVPKPVTIRSVQQFGMLAVDSFGNFLIAGGDSSRFAVHILDAANQTIVNEVQNDVKIIDNCDGTYNVTYKTPSKKGKYLLEVLGRARDEEEEFVLITVPLDVINDCLPDPDCSSPLGDCINSTCVCTPGYIGRWC